MKDYSNKKGIIITLFILFIFGINCNDDKRNQDSDDESFITLTLTSSRSSINEDRILWEDRVDELRMIVFDSQSGDVVFNQILYFPNGFDEQSKAVRLPLGTFNFYFVANETVYNVDFITALQDIENQSEFSNKAVFRNLLYNSNFIPDGTSSSGRFVMSAIYNNIVVTGGGTETNPALLVVPNGKVELIRAMAKVEVIFRKKVSGGEVSEGTITSVLIENVASVLSVPPYDNYYTGQRLSTPAGSLAGLDYSRDSIGSVIFYIPELLLAEGNTNYPTIEINNSHYPIENDDAFSGIALQRRIVPALSNNSVIRNYHYQVNAYIDSEGGLQIRTYVIPWNKDSYTYMFYGDLQITIPPIEPTDTSIILPTECGRIEIHNNNENLSQGLQGAYHDQVIYYDPETQGPIIIRGDPPYYCEQKYGPGWRLINSCELLSFLGVCDAAYTIWLSNTWLAADHNIPYYPLRFRQEAQQIMEYLTGYDLSGNVFYNVNNYEDDIEDTKLDLVDRFFTPGDIMLRIEDFPGGWPYDSPPGTDLEWFYNQVSIQVKAFWYTSGYLSPAIRANWDEILYNQFERYDFSSTVSRCVRVVE